ncbi:hypothetical protein BDF21DRAFT_481434 [Thamnidium elegans]|nr:hypothetical protein BDF21DRAFT_481434 [Thamnidium elegans]
MNWNNLPVEIILQVLKGIPNIYNCSLINKKWHSIAYYLLYKELDIYLSTATSLLHTLSRSQYNPGQYVFRLNIYTLEPLQEEGGDDNDDYINNPLRSLLYNCPYTMDIMPGVLKNMVEYEHFVSLFQELTSVSVDFTLLDSVVENVSSIIESRSVIKYLDITYTEPVSEMDLHLLKIKFFTVNNLNLKFNRANQPDHLFESFFHCLIDVQNYKVSFVDTSNQLILMMKNYYGSLLQSYNKVLDICYVTQSPNTIELVLTKTNRTVHVPSLIFTSKSSFNLKEISQATQSILTDKSLCKYFTTLRFFFDHHQSINRYLIPTLSNDLNHINNLVLTSGKILPILNTVSRQLNTTITKVTINNSDISWLESLSSFFFNFSTISLFINQCKLHREPGTNQIKIKVPKINLNDLYLDLTNLIATSIYIKIQQDQTVKCYFLDTDLDEQDNLSQTIDQVMYDQHLMISQSNVIFVHVHVKNLQKLTVCYNKYAYTLDFNVLK